MAAGSTGALHRSSATWWATSLLAPEYRHLYPTTGSRRSIPFRLSRKGMLRREPVVGYKCLYSGASSDVAHHVAEDLCRAPVEPAAMDVQYDFSGPNVFRIAPQARHSTNSVCFVRHALGCSD